MRTRPSQKHALSRIGFILFWIFLWGMPAWSDDGVSSVSHALLCWRNLKSNEQMRSELRAYLTEKNTGFDELNVIGNFRDKTSNQEVLAFKFRGGGSHPLNRLAQQYQDLGIDFLYSPEIEEKLGHSPYVMESRENKIQVFITLSEVFSGEVEPETLSVVESHLREKSLFPDEGLAKNVEEWKKNISTFYHFKKVGFEFVKNSNIMRYSTEGESDLNQFSRWLKETLGVSLIYDPFTNRAVGANGFFTKEHPSLVLKRNGNYATENSKIQFSFMTDPVPTLSISETEALTLSPGVTSFHEKDHALFEDMKKKFKNNIFFTSFHADPYQVLSRTDAREISYNKILPFEEVYTHIRDFYRYVYTNLRDHKSPFQGTEGNRRWLSRVLTNSREILTELVDLESPYVWAEVFPRGMSVRVSFSRGVYKSEIFDENLKLKYQELLKRSYWPAFLRSADYREATKNLKKEISIEIFKKISIQKKMIDELSAQFELLENLSKQGNAPDLVNRVRTGTINLQRIMRDHEAQYQATF